MTTRWQFWIDVGGTFTDCIALAPNGTVRQHKTLSSGETKGVVGAGSHGKTLLDDRRRSDSQDVWKGYHVCIGKRAEAVANVVGSVGEKIFLDTDLPSAEGDPYTLTSDESAPLVAIRYLLGISRPDVLPAIDIRLGTTRGTNALLTRTGSCTALMTTRGFEDLWEIGYQSRPHLFALDIHKPPPLYAEVAGIAERIAADGTVLHDCDTSELRPLLEGMLSRGIESVAICLLHANVNPVHEQVVAGIARGMRFRNVSVSHEVSSLRKAIPRGDTAILDAYLTPVLHEYIEQLRKHLHPDSELELMTSSGGLTAAADFRGKDSILSGPAGGVVGVSTVTRDSGHRSAIGFDMGGTSTDVTRWAGDFELEYETEKAGVRVASPMMAVETVAAGGGSLCQFDGVKLTVGPASAGASPGPACYGSGGPLAVTDVNFFLGRILPDAFPFDLDKKAVASRLQDQCRSIQEQTGHQYTATELADGYLRVANTNMVEAIRCVTVDRGIDPRNDLLVAFGGAAGQHACAIANELAITKVLLHPAAGILSALGIGQAEVSNHQEVGLYRPLEEFSLQAWDQVFLPLQAAAAAQLPEKYRAKPLDFKQSLDLRFVGLDQPITTPRPAGDDFAAAYRELFQAESGYVPPTATIEVVMARVTASVRQPDPPECSQSVPGRVPRARCQSTLWCDAERHDADVFDRSQLVPGDRFHGPAIVTEKISTIVVEPAWDAEVLSGGELSLTARSVESRPRRTSPETRADPVLLEVFNKRFEAIATQMGSTLRKTSRSVNVKERLDFSCAIFTKQGDLVVNAPHIPVHLGAMGATVRAILQDHVLAPGDVVVTNDPYQGGSHLPDVTVVTPVHEVGTSELLFFTASRAHHAEIGGIAPGSMPPFSRNLAEEGVLIPPTKVVEAGVSRLESLRRHLSTGDYPSRDPDTNIADIVAQIAANRQGAEGLLRFVREYSWSQVAAYMQFIQVAAEQKMRGALRDLPSGLRSFLDYLDDGSPIALQLEITKDTAVLDFAGTGPVLTGNLNANRAIVTAAVMYCLRCFMDEDIPLNQGVLAPVTIRLPPCLLNPSAGATPAHSPAVAGGNVETSQRVVDVILGAFDASAASQGTMNNFLFGDESFGYYETICGGAGATAHGDGADAVHTHMTNTRLTDPEVLESRFPLRLQSFRIRKGSGGAGRHRGGDGVIREIVFLRSLQVSLLSQRRGAYPPYGLHGGQPGALGRNVLIRDGSQSQLLDGSTRLQVDIGDVLRIETPGGGGWGSPSPG